LADLFNAAMSGRSVLSPAIDCGALIVVLVGFILIARFIQIRNMTRGI
jgi:hypothetical protein